MSRDDSVRLRRQEVQAKSDVTELPVKRHPFGPVTLTQTEAEAIHETEFAQLVTPSEAHWLRFYIDNASLHYSLSIALLRREDGRLYVLESDSGLYPLTR
jgi:hypothetical protein